ncbi:deoxynucleoside kinase [Mycoplasma sp. 21DD0573]|uniref:deoxynucleoside kinase n=1 Tax=unclassified Mycoplasma TaxID=2683645 RepID=UPI002B1D4171|nr:deoxynucleoside kinase [Mycoplasma sp. 21DD0573]MEA4276319.1 deoxynucleoside kinase [Mycoplasma sp. 21DD0573]
MVIGISGMIAAGKSSLVKNLQKEFPTSKILREFEESDDVFNTFLNWLYENKPNLTISFQSYIAENHSDKFAKLLDEYNQSNSNIKKDHIFVDRFALEHYIFAKLILSAKSEKYLEAYDAMFEKLVTEDEMPHFAIFLDVDFETFKKRLFARNRESEVKNFDSNYEYFKNLHSNYLKIFKEIASKYNFKYYVIDTNDKDEKQILQEALSIISAEEKLLGQ